MQFKLFEKHTSAKKFQNCEQGKSYDYSWIISEAYNSDNMHEKMYVINIFILFPCFCIMFPQVSTVFTEIYIAPSQSDSINFFHVFYHYQNNSGTVLRYYTCMSMIIGFLFWNSLKIMTTNIALRFSFRPGWKNYFETLFSLSTLDFQKTFAQ